MPEPIDLKQMRLPLHGNGKPLPQSLPWLRESPADIAERRAREEQRLQCIEVACANYRGKGKIRFVTPRTDPRLHLFCDWKLMGVFAEAADGKLVFCPTNGE